MCLSGRDGIIFNHEDSFRHIFGQWENPLVLSDKNSPLVYARDPQQVYIRLLGESLPHHKDFSWLMSSAETANDADDS